MVEVRDGVMDELMDGRGKRWSDGWMDGRGKRCSDGWMVEVRDGVMDG